MNDEWMTPTNYIRLARAAMGGIDVDPFSSAAANERVKATTFYSEDHYYGNGALSTYARWKGRIFMNPPYSRGLIGKAVDRLLVELESGDADEAVVITNASVCSRWGQDLLRVCDGVLFPNKRIAFVDPLTLLPVKGNSRDQMVTYFGPRPFTFLHCADEFGVTMWRSS